MIDRSARPTVGVIQGGTSQEREVSLNTGHACADALRSAGYDVVEIDWTGPNGLQKVLASGIDVAFLALHGGIGEDGSIQGLLNAAAIPYTGSGVLASALAMDKVRSKWLFEGAGLDTPRAAVLTADQVAGQLTLAVAESPVGVPCVVKPSRQGSSVGVTIVRRSADYPEALETALAYGDELLVEVFVEGPELSVGVFDDQVLGTVEIVPALEFYSYEAKYRDTGTQYRIPPSLEAVVVVEVERRAQRAYDLLGCRGVARIDFLVGSDAIPQLLEINTLPGMTSTSLVPKLAQARGESFESLLGRMVRAARIDGEGE